MNNEIETLHNPFLTFLRRDGIPYIRARSDRESTICEGHPDFTLIHGNRSLLIEFKAKGGSLSGKQKKRIAELEAAGNKVFVLRDLRQAIELAQEWKAQTVLAPAHPPDQLYRWQNAVVRRRPNGDFEVVRPQTEGDERLPMLTPCLK